MGMAVYLESGTRRTFAGAVEWPGWCRSGRDDHDALGMLAAYAVRYADALGPLAPSGGFPAVVGGFEVVERIQGDASTEFGVPGRAPGADDRALGPADLERQLAILAACRAALERAVREATGVPLRVGPRGGGRDLQKIVAHVADAEQAYVRKLGVARQDLSDPAAVPEAAERAWRDRDSAGGGAARMEVSRAAAPRGSRWTVRYAIRRSAWHLLDHAWEIEDRSQPATTG